MKFLSFIAFMFCLQTSFSQNVVSYYDGTPALEIKHTNIDGTELLYPEWYEGSIKTKEGKIYSGLKLKYNQLEDRLYYLNANSVSMMFTTPIQEFTIGDSALNIKNKTFRNGFPSFGKFTPDNYFEVLVPGRTMLLKKVVKSIIETKDYNSPVVKKQIIDDVRYYISSDNQMYLIKKDKLAIIEILKEKKSEVEAYMSSQKLNIKKEEDIINIVTYYNSLL